MLLSDVKSRESGIVRGAKIVLHKVLLQEWPKSECNTTG